MQQARRARYLARVHCIHLVCPPITFHVPLPRLPQIREVRKQGLPALLGSLCRDRHHLGDREGKVLR